MRPAHMWYANSSTDNKTLTESGDSFEIKSDDMRN